MQAKILSLAELINTQANESLLSLKEKMRSIFWESSSKKNFKNEEEKSLFIYQYLESYLEQPHYCFLALSENAFTHPLMGYLVGTLKTTDHHFKNNSYLKNFKEEIQSFFPSHLHLNLTTSARGQGTGSSLIHYFEKVAIQNQSPGIHLFTLKDERNVSFYKKNNYNEIKSFKNTPNTTLLMLGKKLI